MNPFCENVFNDERASEDICLVNEITTLLTNSGVENPSSWTQNQMINEAINSGPMLERFLVNRYWRMKFAEAPTNESKALASLRELRDLPTPIYLEVFNKFVVPRIVFCNLI